MRREDVGLGFRENIKVIVIFLGNLGKQVWVGRGEGCYTGNGEACGKALIAIRMVESRVIEIST